MQGYLASARWDFDDNLLYPRFSGADAITYTYTLASNRIYYYYCGVSVNDASSVNVAYRVTSVGTTVAWFEVGVFSGPTSFPLGPSASPFTLNLLGATSVTSTVSQYNINIPCTVKSGSQIWVAFGASAVAGPTLRSLTADYIRSGAVQITNGSDRISNQTASTGTVVGSVTDSSVLFFAAYINGK